MADDILCNILIQCRRPIIVEDSSSRSASAIYYLKNTVNLTNLKFALGEPAENLMQVGTVGTMRMKIRVCTWLQKVNALASRLIDVCLQSSRGHCCMILERVRTV